MDTILEYIRLDFFLHFITLCVRFRLPVNDDAMQTVTDMKRISKPLYQDRCQRFLCSPSSPFRPPVRIATVS